MFVYMAVFIAAAVHAYWNFLAKTIPSGAPFVWLVAVCATIILLPFVIWHMALYDFPTDAKSLVFLLGTGLLHLVYFLVLQKGYQRADLSVVYPLARGTGPLFSTLGAILFLNERLSPAAIAGLGFVLAGVLFIAGINNAARLNERTKAGIFYGLTTGILIAGYTVLDGYAVKVLALPPLLIEFASQPFRVLALAGTAARQWQEVRSVWQKYGFKILTISTLGPFGFILVLYAMQTAPVHFVAPARELSIVFGVVLGGKMLSEANFLTRLAGAALMLLGIGLLVL
jgi:drug/metabolite transporter (DMT)-like permease